MGAETGHFVADDAPVLVADDAPTLASDGGRRGRGSAAAEGKQTSSQAGTVSSLSGGRAARPEECGEGMLGVRSGKESAGRLSSSLVTSS